MQVIIDRDAFSAALTAVKRTVERRNSLPVLANVLLTAGDGRLSIKASNQDMESSADLPCDARQGGAVTLPAHVLADMVKAAPKGGQIALESIEGVPGKRWKERTTAGDDVYDEFVTPRVKIRAGASAATLSGIQAEDFPEIEAAPKWSRRFLVNAQQFKRLLDATSFAISTEETRYYLNGIFLHVDKDGSSYKLRSVATDGHRLAQADMPAPEGAEGMPGVIVPRLCVVELAKLIGKSKGDLYIAANEKHIEFQLDGFTLLSKTIDGTFPDYRRVVPYSADKRLVCDKASLVAAIKRVTTLSSERGRAVKLGLKAGRVVLSVNNPDAGEIRDEVDADFSAELESFEIGFSARYLLDIAGAYADSEMQFYFSDAGGPALIAPYRSAPEIFVLMPVRV